MEQYPDPTFLEVFGYLHQVRIFGIRPNVGFVSREDFIPETTEYMLTSKAFRLLEKPASPPDIFISYRRSTSSALGLLIVARLQAKGILNPFIDMNIDPGEQWHSLLEDTIKKSRYFISLIAPGSFSEYVQKEIKWAMETPGCEVIPIWHNGYQGEDMPDHLKHFLEAKNAIIIKDESADEYNNAIVKLLNKLGYAPQ